MLAGAYFTGQSADAEHSCTDVSSLQDGGDLARQFSSLVGQSEAMRRLFAQLQAAALALAEPPCSSEKAALAKSAARAAASKSRGVKRPFVAVNCAALPRDLIEELFGPIVAARMAARRPNTAVWCAQRRQGHCFSTKSPKWQLKSKPSCCACWKKSSAPSGGTWRNCRRCSLYRIDQSRSPKAVAAGLLQEDLYYRISAFRVDLPPLRSDGATSRFWSATLPSFYTSGDFARSNNSTRRAACSQTYTWPGGVRELRNAIDFALTVGVVPRFARRSAPHVLRGAAPPSSGDAPASGDSRRARRPINTRVRQ